MTLLDLFKDLTYGELSQLSFGNMMPDDNESEPDPKAYAQLISHINRGLTALYSRFLLQAKEIYIQQYEEFEIYELHSKYAASNVASTEPIKYIEDSVANPFLDDILKIEECYDEVGNKLFLNDVTEELSIFTPSYRSIQIPYPNDFNMLAVQYRANHPRIDYVRGMDPSAIEIHMPGTLYEALLFYIAHRVFGAQNTDGGVEGNDYWKKYNNICVEAETKGLYIQAEPGDWRFDHKGWV